MSDAHDGQIEQAGAHPRRSEFSAIVAVATRRQVRFGSSLTIGRHPSNGLCLDEPLVSSFHAVIEWGGDGWSVRDLGSRNGTSLNSRRLSGRAALREGDILRFARSGSWCVERLRSDPPGPADATLERTLGVDRTLPPDLRLDLLAIGPAEGLLTARWGEQVLQQNLVGTHYLLLDRLCQGSRSWVTDAELRRCLWGRKWEEMSRSALHQPIYTLRRLFESWGIVGAIIEKEHGATRLTLEPEQVARVGQRGEQPPDRGPDGEE
ncbi:MAG: FHA domain-containing protein [Pseudomonadota bacterium]